MSDKKSEYLNDNEKISLAIELRYAGSMANLSKIKKVVEKINVKSYLLDPKVPEYNYLMPSCILGKLDVLRYLLTEPNLVIDIHQNNEEALREACKKGDLKIVKFLLESPEIKEHADIYASNALPFKFALACNDSSVVEYLLFEYKIEKTKEVLDLLKGKSNILEMIEKYDFKEHLSQELDDKSAVKSNKI